MKLACNRNVAEGAVGRLLSQWILMEVDWFHLAQDKAHTIMNFRGTIKGLGMYLNLAAVCSVCSSALAGHGGRLCL
jgi:hypothetical protein